MNRLLSHFRRLSEGDLTSEVRWSSRDEMAELVKGVTGMQRSLADTVRQGQPGFRSDLDGDAPDRGRQHRPVAAHRGTGVRAAGNGREHGAAHRDREAERGQCDAGAGLRGYRERDRHARRDGGRRSDRHDERDRPEPQKVADIIGTIEGIAFQTNILALNAAVEARAREQGRGFAVVAGEVRTLAQRSASAAKEIRTLIGESVERVATGSRLVGTAGATMQDIQQAIGRVTGIMTEIAAASNEQRDGIEQVNRAVSQMDQVSQQNAALVEQAAAAAASLEEQADGLRRAVGRSASPDRPRAATGGRWSACRPTVTSDGRELRGRARRRDDQQLHRRTRRADEQLARGTRRACRSRPR